MLVIKLSTDETNFEESKFENREFLIQFLCHGHSVEQLNEQEMTWVS